jgi:hypothetical protein
VGDHLAVRERLHLCDECGARTRLRKRQEYLANYYREHRDKKLAAAKTRYAEKRNAVDQKNEN